MSIISETATPLSYRGGLVGEIYSAGGPGGPGGNFMFRSDDNIVMNNMYGAKGIQKQGGALIGNNLS